MKQQTRPLKEPAEKVVQDIRRATRNHYSAEEKIRIVLEGLRGEDSIAELCPWTALYFDPRLNRLQVHQMIGPGLFQVHVSVAPEGCLGTTSEQGFVLYQTITPESEDTLIWRRSTSCRVGTKWAADRSKPLVDAILAGAPVVVAQDKWAIERQQEMLAFADEGYREVHVKTDGAMMMARQVLNRMEAAEREASTSQVLKKSARAEGPWQVQEQKEVL
jgi:hypothetical protein